MLPNVSRWEVRNELVFLFGLVGVGVSVNGASSSNTLTNVDFTGADHSRSRHETVNKVRWLAFATRDGLIYAMFIPPGKIQAGPGFHPQSIEMCAEFLERRKFRREFLRNRETIIYGKTSGNVGYVTFLTRQEAINLATILAICLLAIEAIS